MVTSGILLFEQRQAARSIGNATVPITNPRRTNNDASRRSAKRFGARLRILVRITWAEAAEPRAPRHSIADSNPPEARNSRRRDRNPNKAAEAGHRASCAGLASLAFPSWGAGDDVGDGRLSKSIAPLGRAPQSSHLATIDFLAASRTRGFRCVARAAPARCHSDLGYRSILLAIPSCSPLNGYERASLSLKTLGVHRGFVPAAFSTGPWSGPVVAPGPKYDTCTTPTEPPDCQLGAAA